MRFGQMIFDPAVCKANLPSPRTTQVQFYEEYIVMNFVPIDKSDQSLINLAD